MNIFEWACEINVYDPRKYEPFQTKAFIEPELPNVIYPALMNMSLTLEIIGLIWSLFNYVFYPIRSIQVNWNRDLKCNHNI